MAKMELILYNKNFDDFEAKIRGVLDDSNSIEENAGKYISSG